MSESEVERLIRYIRIERTELGRELRAHNYDRALAIAAQILRYVDEVRDLESTQSQEVAQ